MILPSITDLKKYVAISKNLSPVWEDFMPYVTKAVNQFTFKFIGPLHIELEEVATGTNADKKNTARELLREALANFALFLYLPLAQVQFDSSGITTSQNANRKNAEWWQINDIRRDFLSSGHFAMDRLLAYLEANKTVFVDWNNNYSTLNNELLVSSAAEFDKYYNIFESRQTYLALQPSLRQVEDQYINTLLCPELVSFLKVADVSNENHKSVKVALQKAVVAFTIAKIYDEGMFLVDATGVKLKYDLLPSEAVKVPDYGKQADQITRAVKKQNDNGVSYLKAARKTIENNIDDFDQCVVVFINQNNTGSGFKPYNTRGVLGL